MISPVNTIIQPVTLRCTQEHGSLTQGGCRGIVDPVEERLWIEARERLSACVPM